jgi:hypothetical protein
VDRWRLRWPWVALAVLLSGLAIFLAEPHYTDLQTADDAGRFVELLDHPRRAILAAGFDIVFAAAYGLLFLIGLRTHSRGRRICPWASAAVVTGALADEVENLLVIANAARRRTVTDGWIDAMQVPGTIKWVAEIGLLVLLGLMLTNWVQDRRATSA